MRPIGLAASFTLVAAAIASSPLSAQELQVNQRLTAPTAQADAYAGMTLGRLILALGLSLQGLPPDLRGEALKSRLQSMSDSERRPVRVKSVPAPAPLVATVPVVPATVVPAVVSVAPAVAVVPAVAVKTEPAPSK